MRFLLAIRKVVSETENIQKLLVCDSYEVVNGDYDPDEAAFYLWHADFESMSSRDVWCRGEVIQDALKLAWEYEIELGPVIEILENGTYKKHVVGSAQIVVSSAIHVAGTGRVTGHLSTEERVVLETRRREDDEEKQFKRQQERLIPALHCPQVRKVLKLMEDEQTPGVLWNIFELIRADVGGQNALFKTNWFPKGEIEGFQHSVNDSRVIGRWARHIKEFGDLPKRKMDISEARDFMDRLIRTWLRQKKRKIESSFVTKNDF